VLVRAIGFRGLALATSIAALIHGSLCVLLLRRQLGGIGLRHLGSTLLTTAMAAGAMAAVTVTVDHALYGIASGGGALRQAIALSASIAAGLSALILAARLLRIPEFDEVTRELRTRVRKLLDR
jgi:putative peptidoglycan lipid II flippase